MLSALWINSSKSSVAKCHSIDGAGEGWSLGATKFMEANFGMLNFILLDGNNGY